MPTEPDRPALLAQLAAVTSHMATTTEDHMLALDIASKFVARDIVEELERLSPGFSARLGAKLGLLAEIAADKEQAEAFNTARAVLDHGRIVQ